MNKYLEKIAKEANDKKKKFGIGAGLGVGYLAGTAGHYANMAGTKPVMHHLREKSVVDKHTMKKILRDNKDLNVTFSSNKAFGPEGAVLTESLRHTGPVYMDKQRGNELINRKMGKFSNGKEEVIKRNHISMGKGGKFHSNNIEVALHELGHARDAKNLLNKGKLGKAIGRAEIAAKMGALPVGAFGGGAMLANKKTRDYAWTVPLLSHAPTLRSEGAANYHGYKMIAKHGTGAMKRRFLSLAGKNMLGYAAAPVATSAILHGVAKHLDKRDKEQK